MTREHGEDEIPMGAGNELPAKAHFRRTENRWLLEKRGGVDGKRVADITVAFTKQVIRFCDLNAPTYAELAYAIAEVLTYIECNPSEVGVVLDKAAYRRAAYLADPANKTDEDGCYGELADDAADYQLKYGHTALSRALSRIAGQLFAMTPAMRSIRGPRPAPTTAPVSEQDNYRAPFDYAGKPFADIFADIDAVIRRARADRSSAGIRNAQETTEEAAQKMSADAIQSPSAVEKIVADMVDTDATEGVGQTNERWCSACQTFHD